MYSSIFKFQPLLYSLNVIVITIIVYFYAKKIHKLVNLTFVSFSLFYVK